MVQLFEEGLEGSRLALCWLLGGSRMVLARFLVTLCLMEDCESSMASSSSSLSTFGLTIGWFLAGFGSLGMVQGLGLA